MGRWIDDSDNGLGKIIFEPDGDLIKRFDGKIDYMGLIQLCSLGNMNGSAMFPEWEPYADDRLPTTYAGDGNEEGRYKRETLFKGYFVDQVFNTTSPFFCSSLYRLHVPGASTAGLNVQEQQQLNENLFSEFEEKSGNKTLKDYGVDENCFAFGSPDKVAMIDSYACTDDFEKDFLVFAACCVGNKIIVTDGYHWGHRDGKGPVSFGAIAQDDVLNGFYDILVGCMEKYNTVSGMNYNLMFLQSGGKTKKSPLGMFS